MAKINVMLLSIQNASFLYKTAISKANVKANKMVSTKWIYHTERSFAINCFIFLETGRKNIRGDMEGKEKY